MANNAAAASQAADQTKSAGSSDPLSTKVGETRLSDQKSQKNGSNGEEEDDSEEDDTGVVQVESLCMNCEENGETRILLYKIPFFRDILLESFECPHCHLKNNSVKAAGQIQEQGSQYTLEVEGPQDLERQVVKSDSAIFRLETLGIEMPKGEGQLTNVEGILSRVSTHLQGEQPVRKIMDPPTYEALEQILEKINQMVQGEAYPFTISLDDPSGNSWIAPTPHDEGTKYKRRDYPRTREQNEELGIGNAETDGDKRAGTSAGGLEDLDIVDGKVYSLPSECPGCTKPCVINMQKVNIPNFKEVFIWSTVCDHCGYRTNEVKTGGEVPEKGSRVTLQVETIEDLSRDILKSTTCALSSAELEMSVQPGSLGGRFTTVEGLLTEVRDQLRGQIFETGDEDLAPGDSMAQGEKASWDRFFSRLGSAIKGDLKFTIALEDPLASSYVQDLYEPEPDPRIKIEEYTRTDEEDEELGLKDMKTEGYEEAEKES